MKFVSLAAGLLLLSAPSFGATHNGKNIDGQEYQCGLTYYAQYNPLHEVHVKGTFLKGTCHFEGNHVKFTFLGMDGSLTLANTEVPDNGVLVTRRMTDEPFTLELGLHVDINKSNNFNQ